MRTDKRRAADLEHAIAAYLFGRLWWPRSRDIHSAICADWPMVAAPKLSEVRSALQKMKAGGRVRTSGHYAWQLTDRERASLARSERQAWGRFDAKGVK